MRADAATSLALLTLFAPVVAAQPPPTPPPGSPSVDWAVTGDIMRDLPAANLLAILETMQPELAADRFNNGGLAAGGTSHIVAPLGSAAQTRYRIGDIDIASPITGEPMLFPELAFWQRIGTTTGLMPADVNSPGLSVALDPARPTSRWAGFAEGFASGRALVSSGAADGPPPVVRLHDWAHGTLLLGGPIGRRNSLVAGGAWSQSDAFVRGRRDRVRERARSLFAHHFFTPSPHRELRTLGWVQSVRAPATTATAADRVTTGDTSIHAQSTFHSSEPGQMDWRVFGGYTERRRHEDQPAAERLVDRLVDGPIPLLVPGGDSVERRWALGGRVSPARRGRHLTSVGADVTVASNRSGPASPIVIRELVDGAPARLWVYSTTGLASARRATTVSGFAAHRIELTPTSNLDVAVSYERVAGAAESGLTQIVWHSLLPRLALDWGLGTRAALTLVSGYRRTANQLTLDLLAQGDPAAPFGRVFRWDGATPNVAGPLVSRVGPGTGGEPVFIAIDPAVKRSHADEFVIALESNAWRTSVLRVTGIARRQSPLVSLVNVGVTIDDHRVFLVPDPNADLVGAGDDQQLPVYERRPESFGQDRYLLANPIEEPATLGAIVISAQITTPRLFMFIGATASASVGQGASRGFRAIENDPGAIGERRTSPNAATNARGRLFSDRAYTIKWTTVYRFPRNIRLGAIARYQDGQPFSRLVIVPGLAQGTEVIQAFPNGRSRFAFTGTLDVRLGKGFAVGPAQLEAMVDVYNLLGLGKEVEEYVVTGDRFRSPTFVQPPRTAHVGLRLTF